MATWVNGTWVNESIHSKTFPSIQEIVFTYLHVIKCLLHFIINCSLMSVTLVGGFFCSACSESHFQPQPSGCHPPCCSWLSSALPTAGRSDSRLIGYSGLLAFFPCRKDHPPFPLTHLLSFPYGRRRKKEFSVTSYVSVSAIQLFP